LTIGMRDRVEIAALIERESAASAIHAPHD
jgi:hypothetical protein